MLSFSVSMLFRRDDGPRCVNVAWMAGSRMRRSDKCRPVPSWRRQELWRGKFLYFRIWLDERHFFKGIHLQGPFSTAMFVCQRVSPCKSTEVRKICYISPRRFFKRSQLSISFLLSGYTAKCSQLRRCGQMLRFVPPQYLQSSPRRWHFLLLSTWSPNHSTPQPLRTQFKKVGSSMIVSSSKPFIA